jgi:hypothetical protein
VVAAGAGLSQQHQHRVRLRDGLAEAEQQEKVLDAGLVLLLVALRICAADCSRGVRYVVLFVKLADPLQQLLAADHRQRPPDQVVVLVQVQQLRVKGAHPHRQLSHLRLCGVVQLLLGEARP